MTDRHREDDATSWIARAVDRTGVGVFRVDHAAQTFARANDALARILGAESGEALVGRSILDLYTDPGERAEIAARLMGNPRFRETGRATVKVRRLKQDTRELVDLSIHVAATFEADGRVATMDCVIEEIGEDRLIERAFRQSEERFRVLFETSFAAMALADLEGRLTRVNPALSRFLQRSEAELVGASLLDLVTASDRPASLVPGPSAPDGARGVSLGERAFPLPDGSLAWGQVTGSWLGASEGEEPHSIVFVLQDITERKRAEQGLARVARLEALGVLAGGLAHDLNNALSVVLASLDVAGRRAAIDPVLAEALEDAERGARRSAELARQLLTFAKGGSPTRRVGDAGRVLRDAVSLCLRRSSARLELEVPSELPRCEFDPAQLAQVFENLLINADQATAARTTTGAGRISVAAAAVEITERDALPLRPGAYLRFTVDDDGVGIPREHLDRVFDPYFTTKAGGTGLGLAVAHSIVVKHGGHCAVESEVGRGTRFAVYLPVTDLAPSAASRPAPNAAASPAVRALVMDDDDAVRRVAMRILSAGGFEPVGARDGAEALAAYREGLTTGRPFGVVILDLTIPGGMGGEETIKRLRELDPDVRAVVASGYADSPVVVDWRTHGFSGALGKPFTPDDLVREAQAAMTAPRSH